MVVLCDPMNASANEADILEHPVVHVEELVALTCLLPVSSV